MFSCRDATNLITEETEGALSGGGRFKYRFHMSICPHCKAFRRQLGDAIALVKEIPPEPVPREIEDRLVEAFRDRRK